MISARNTLVQWCEVKLRRYQFDTVNFKTTPREDSLDKAGLDIEVGKFVASFTAWGDQGTTEWLVMDIESGETIISRDECFTDEAQLVKLLENAMLDIQASEPPPTLK